LRELGVRALNTFEPSGIDSKQQWTWSNPKSNRYSQIDFLCVCDNMEGEVAVHAKKIKSDHHPVGGRVFAAQPFACRTRAAKSFIGWQPDDEDATAAFRQGCMESCGIAADGRSCMSTFHLKGLEENVLRQAAAVRHSTAGLRTWRAAQPTGELAKAKQTWKGENFGVLRKQHRRAYVQLERREVRQRKRGQLRRIAFRGPDTFEAPHDLFIAGEAVATTSREAWRSAARVGAAEQYANPANTIDIQSFRLQCLRTEDKDWRLDGRKMPGILLTEVFAVLAGFRTEKAAGMDGVPYECWKLLPQAALLAVWELFSQRLLGDTSDEYVSQAWKAVDLTAIKKCVGRPKNLLADFRYIARLPTLQTWYLACVVRVIRRTLKPSCVQLYGFRAGCGTIMITEALRRCLHLARDWVGILPLFKQIFAVPLTA